MRTAVDAKLSIFELVHELRDEIKTFIKQEFELAKTEMSEKASRLTRNAVWLAVGALVAYAGIIVLFIGLGFLLALAFQSLGLRTELAYFLGQAIVGILVAVVGYLFIAKALKAFSQETLAPERTLHTLQDLEGTSVPTQPDATYAAAASVPEPKPEPERTSAEIEANVLATRAMLEDTAEEIRERLTPRELGKSFATQVKVHPLRAGLIGAGTGLALSLLFRWRRRHARA